jgi:hypothetical protein
VRGADLTRERIPLTLAGADSLRSLVTSGLAEYKTTPTLDSSGRPLFVTSSTLMCFGFYGWAIPYLFFDENTSSETVTGTYLVTASAGTFLPLWLTRNRPVSMGSALMSWYGMSRGTLHGALLPFALTEDPAEKSPVGTAFTLSIVEGIAGFEWAARTNMSDGTAATINEGGDFGLLYGLGFSHLFDADGSGKAAASLIGSGVGLTAAALYAPHRNHVYGDASVMRTAGWIGGYMGLAIVQTLGSEEYTKSSTAGALTGATVGLVLGDGFVRRRTSRSARASSWTCARSAAACSDSGSARSHAGDSDVQRRVYWSASALGSDRRLRDRLLARGEAGSEGRGRSFGLEAGHLPLPPAHARRNMPGATVMLSTAMR